MTPQQQFLLSARDAAAAAEHPFPEYAACEAALESGWGHSTLALQANNLFGQKQSVPPIAGTTTLVLPTREFIRGVWVVIQAKWAQFPALAACFAARVALLKRLAPGFPHYKAALAATTGEQFIVEVSKTWSTDPNRAGKVLQLHDEYAAFFTANHASSGEKPEAGPPAAAAGIEVPAAQTA